MRTVSIVVLGAIAMAVGFSGLASAADLQVRRPITKAPAPVVAPAAVYNWTGFYIGGHVGYAWGEKEWSDPFDGESFGSHDVSGLIAGGQIGFNWQAGNWVFGIEGQASWADVDGSHDFEGDTGTTKVKWLGTIAGRLGYAFDRVLVYAKGGAAFAHDEHQVLDLGIVEGTADKTRWGWMVGGGIEVALSGNWSIKGEYNYMDFGKKALAFSDGFETQDIDIDQHIHVVKFGVNYRFGGAAPVIAKY